MAWNCRGLSGGSIFPDARSENKRSGEGDYPSASVYDGGSGKMVETGCTQAAANSNQMALEWVNRYRGKDGDDDVGGKLRPFGHRSGDDCRSGCAEHRLEAQNAFFGEVAVRIERIVEKMKAADESVAFGVHQRKAEHPEENRARHEVNEILHQNIGCVFGTGESGFHECESGLHEKNKH